MGIELAEIFRQYGPAYREKYAGQIPFIHLEVMRAIEQCRTEALGGQVYVCPECGEIQYRYHSCRNRHCPKCQNDRAQAWLEAQQDLLLPVPYFMLTFTLPSGLNTVIRSHPAEMYDLLFRVSAAATQDLAKILVSWAVRSVWWGSSTPGDAIWLTIPTSTTSSQAVGCLRMVRPGCSPSRTSCCR